MTTQQIWPHPDIQADLITLRHRIPLVHCLTNIVVSGFTANVLLAIGASPAMVIAEEEAAEFAAIASAVLINVGTITNDQSRSIGKAVIAANGAGKPWVLDPVAVGFLSLRTQVATELLSHRPTVIRGNASEIIALAGGEAGGRGVDSTASSNAAVDAAKALAKKVGTVVAVSGEIDYITDGSEVIEVPGGHVIMTRVTGTGCSLGAVIAAFLGAGIPPLRAATAASAIYAHAGERAFAQSRGPGSFAVAFLDELALIGIQSE